MRITLVGCGALGSFFLDFAQHTPGVDFIHVIDGDRVEAKNLEAQAFTKPALRQNKALAIARQIGPKIKPYSVFLKPENSSTLLMGSNLVIDCTDNGTARKLIAHTCYCHRIDLVHAGIDAAGTFGKIFWQGSNVIPDNGGEGKVTCEDAENRAHHALVAAVLAKVVLFWARDRRKRNVKISGATVEYI